MSVYTYVVDHGKGNPVVKAEDTIKGGKIKSVMFSDALKRLEEIEAFLADLRIDTKCSQTKYSIDDFMN